MSNGIVFEDNSDEVKRQMANVSEEALKAALLFIEGQAKAKAPVATGELRDKIDHRIDNQGKTLVGYVGSPFLYAFYVEFGTGEYAENGNGRKGGWNYKDPSGEWFFTFGQEPQPFLRPAFRRNRKQIEDIIGGKFKASFDGG